MSETRSTTRARGTRLVNLPPLTAAPPAPEQDAARRSLIRLRLDLHDGPMQDLTAVGFTLASLQRELDRLDADTSSAQQVLDEVTRQLVEVERTLRSVAEGEHEFELRRIVDVVDAEVTRFTQWNGANVEVDLSGDIEPETDSQRIALQRVLREALTNVARHAHATEVRVQLFELDEAVGLCVEDNGRGCDPTAASSSGDGHGLGLAGMRERLELLGGSLSFTSVPGGPTTVTATVKRWRPQRADGSPADGAGRKR